MSDLGFQLSGLESNAIAKREEGALVRARSMADDGKSTEAAEEFNALLSTMLVKELRKALPEGGFFRGPGADTYQSWLDNHLGRAMADSDALGLVGMVKASLGRRADREQVAADGQPTPGRNDQQPEGRTTTEVSK